MAGDSNEAMPTPPLKRRKGSHLSDVCDDAGRDAIRTEGETAFSFVLSEAANEEREEGRRQLPMGSFSAEFAQQLRDELSAAKEQIAELRGQLEEATFEAKTTQRRVESTGMSHADEKALNDLRKEYNELQKKFGHQKNALNLMRFERNEWKRQAEEESGKNSELSSLMKALSDSSTTDVEATKRAMELEEECKLMRQAAQEWREEVDKEKKLKKGISEELALLRVQLKVAGEERRRFEKERDMCAAKVARLQKQLEEERMEIDRLRTPSPPLSLSSATSMQDITVPPQSSLPTVHSAPTLTTVSPPPPSVSPPLPTVNSMPRTLLAKPAPPPAKTTVLAPPDIKPTVSEPDLAKTTELPPPPATKKAAGRRPPPAAKTTVPSKTTVPQSSSRPSASRPSTGGGSRVNNTKRQTGSSSMNWRDTK